jgi:Ca-activated chloride channel homolog
MKAARQFRRHSIALIVTTFLFVSTSEAGTQLLLTRGTTTNGEYKGVVELTVNPGFDGARVTISVDGQKIADGLTAPYRVIVDFGPLAVEHKIAISAAAPNRRRIQWQETINRGQLPLSVNVKAVDLANRVFEAVTTSPKEDPVTTVELWDAGTLVTSTTTDPFRFTVPENVLATGFVQVTARTKSGEEAADFWSSHGDVHVESIQVRTVPIFVSVVDRNGATLDNVDRSLFRILDNEAEAKIIEFGKAFDQPISIALLLDASASMTYSMGRATKAAQEFAQRTLKSGDRCSVYAVQEVPRRKQPLTGELTLVEKALQTFQPSGQTALFDALTTAIRELKDEKNRRAIVVLTDGGDTASIASFDEMEKAAMQAGIPMYFIAYDTGGEMLTRDIERLRHISAETGGFVAVATDQSLLAKYNEIERDLRAQFAIRYQVTDFARTNEWRRVRVVLASPKMTARTIRGYFAP